MSLMSVSDSYFRLSDRKLPWRGVSSVAASLFASPSCCKSCAIPRSVDSSWTRGVSPDFGRFPRLVRDGQRSSKEFGIRIVDRGRRKTKVHGRGRADLTTGYATDGDAHLAVYRPLSRAPWKLPATPVPARPSIPQPAPLLPATALALNLRPRIASPPSSRYVSSFGH